MRGLTPRLVMQHHTAQLCARFAPLQLGVGMKGATEYITRKLRRVLREHPSASVLQVDLSNAFNTVDRSAAIAALSRDVPDLAAWCRFSYCSPAHLHCGDRLFPSTQGTDCVTKQPKFKFMADLLRLVALHPQVKLIKDRFRVCPYALYEAIVTTERKMSAANLHRILPPPPFWRSSHSFLLMPARTLRRCAVDCSCRNQIFNKSLPPAVCLILPARFQESSHVVSSG